MKLVSTIALATCLLLAACGKDASPATTLNLPAPPQAWMKTAAPLPPLPECGKLATEKKRIDCRAQYDATVRKMYVDLADKDESLIQFVNRLGLKDYGWSTATIR